MRKGKVTLCPKLDLHIGLKTPLSSSQRKFPKLWFQTCPREQKSSKPRPQTAIGSFIFKFATPLLALCQGIPGCGCVGPAPWTTHNCPLNCWRLQKSHPQSCCLVGCSVASWSWQSQGNQRKSYKLGLLCTGILLKPQAAAKSLLEAG